MEIIWGTDSQLTPHPVLCCPSPSTVCPIQSNCDAGNLVSLPVRAGDIVHLVRHIRSLDAGIRAFGFDEAFRRTVGVPLVRGAGVGAGGLSHFITGDTSVECLITVPFPRLSYPPYGWACLVTTYPQIASCLCKTDLVSRVQNPPRPDLPVVGINNPSLGEKADKGGEWYAVCGRSYLYMSRKRVSNQGWHWKRM